MSATLHPERRNAWLVYLGAPISMMGIQLIAPTLPAMAEALDLTDSQLALISTFYLLPAALGAIPAGVLADRIGRRRVFGYAMIAFGVIGLVLPLVASNLPVFLILRLLQGVAFAGLMPLTMTILGDAFDGPLLVQAQGRRSVSMSLADSLLPMIGGLLVAFGWFFPWFLQGLAIPFGFVVLRWMTDVFDQAAAKVRSLRQALSPELWKKFSVWALQYMGFARLWIKFTMLTFLPVLIVNDRGGTAAVAGFALGLSAFANAIVAASGGRIARRWQPTGWMTLAIVLMTIGLIVVPLAESPGVIAAAAIFYGAADALLGIFLNALVTAVPEPESRAAFVAATGAIRNLGKFFAPTVFGLMLLAITVPEAFLVIAMVSALSIPAPWLFRSLTPRLQGGVT